MKRDTGKPLNMDYEELRQFTLRGEYDIVQASTAFNLCSMFKSALNVAEQLHDYSYEILHAPKRFAREGTTQKSRFPQSA